MPPWVVGVALVTGVIGLLIGNGKGHPVWGFFLGFVLSVIGLLVIAVTKPSPEYQAKKAAERMRAERDGAALLAAEDRNRHP